MKALHRLNFIKKTEYKKLREAYVFLRDLENRVQISFGLQTHVLPEDKFLLAVLSRKMNIVGGSIEELNEKLNNKFIGHTKFVSDIFSDLFKKEQEGKVGEHKSKISEIRSLE